MSKNSKILLTNDDGFFSSGLRSLWEAVSDYPNVAISAPLENMSGSGTGITLTKPLRIDPIPWEKGISAWKVNGKPADCVKLGMKTLLNGKPDLILSGINQGSNVGRTIFYSGTVGGVIEGALRNIPGIAFSCEASDKKPNYDFFKPYILSIVEHFFQHPIPPSTFLNVNFPCISKPLQGIRLARQGLGYHIDNLDERVHPTEGTPYFWLGEKWKDYEEPENSDVLLLRQGFITVVPIYVGELTHYHFIDSHKKFFDEKLNLTFKNEEATESNLPK